MGGGAHVSYQGGGTFEWWVKIFKRGGGVDPMEDTMIDLELL